jgi:hypothetical protein
MPLRVLLITQNTNVKIPKYPQRQSFFFVFSDAKIVICLYSEIKKTWISLWKKAKETFICSRKDKKLKVKLLLQSTVKYLLIYSDSPSPTPFIFCYNKSFIDSLWFFISIYIFPHHFISYVFMCIIKQEYYYK